jgi:succinate dehydrogenase flavin-adding protein (antitoxin of CptAB toxin-antitoxin module)
MGFSRRALFSTVTKILNSPVVRSQGSVYTAPILSNNLYQTSVCSFFCLFSSSNYIQSVDIDLSTVESKRRLFNRLIYRSKQRGFLELDLILGKWVEDNIHSMDENGIKSLVDVLNLENPDLWKWVTGQEQPPDAINVNPVFSEVRSKVMNNLENHASQDTRAIAGQPWVRGWDDFKKGKDSPILGNQ